MPKKLKHRKKKFIPIYWFYVVRRKELEKENEELKAMLPKDEKMTDKKVVVSISSKKETEIRFSEESEIRYLMIPIKPEDVVMVNGKKR